MKPFFLALILLIHSALSAEWPFLSHEGWETFGKVSLGENPSELKLEEPEGEAILVNTDRKKAKYVETKEAYGDCEVELEFMVPKGSNSGVYLMGRYEIQIFDSFGKKTPTHADLGGVYQRWDDARDPKGWDGIEPSQNAAKAPGEWQTMKIRFRAPRLNGDGALEEEPAFLSVHVNGVEVQKNVVLHGPTRAAPKKGFAATDKIFVQGDHGPVAIRKFVVRPQDFSKLPGDLQKAVANTVDLVVLGAETFEAVGCVECHSVMKNDPASKTGPSLFGLFQKEARTREVADAAGKRSEANADLDYLTSSLHAPLTELAVAEAGPTKDQAYLPVMPPYPAEVLGNQKVDALFRYLQTLNDADQRGPEKVVVVDTTEKRQVRPTDDPGEILVTDTTRIFRARLPGSSARAVYVDTPSGLNYAFDPRNFSIQRVWWGGFLNLSNEMDGRGGNLSSLGHNATEVPVGEGLLIPIDPKTGEGIDLSFKSPMAGDTKTVADNLRDDTDFADQLANAGARFKGYSVSRDINQSPVFFYEVGENSIELRVSGGQDGKVSIQLKGKLKTRQSFRLPPNLDFSIQNLKAAKATTAIDKLTLEPNENLNVTVDFQLADPTTVWRPIGATENLSAQKVTPAPNAVILPAGYEAETVPAPLDRNGRPQLFEPLGMAAEKNGGLIVTTRTAGVWRYYEGEWTQIADGLLDAMGVVIEDEKNFVVGQKPELTRLTDENGDGVIDRYETISDDFILTENYHEYLHGPARDKEGNYYVALNLSCSEGPQCWHAGGRWMGTTGGYRGWALQISPEGKTMPFASGLRSPAGLAAGPDGEVYYIDNQGSYNGTSKVHHLKKDGFYGFPASLVDLPGMKPDAPEIAWEKVKPTREPAVALLPHGRLANSPGSPVWDLTGGKFGPFENHAFVGDQTLSTLFHLNPHGKNGAEGTSIIPFGQNFPAGVMRGVFAPDGSLYVGQTGRGWRSKGGNEDGLTRVTFHPEKAGNLLRDITAEEAAFTFHFTRPLAEKDFEKIAIGSWTYVDQPEYGSPETDKRNEKILSRSASEDGKSFTITLEAAPIDGPRLYHFQSEGLTPANEAFFSLK